MRRNKVDIITLGCSKNLVDSERLLLQFRAEGYSVRHNPARPDAEVVVVNTCGFIADAQQESVDTILELGQAKREGRIGKLIVMGCLSERFLAELADELPEVDRFYGKFNWSEMLHDLGKAWHKELEHERVLTTPPHYAYIKISEGCNRHCAFCAIPLITGPHKSVPQHDVLEQVKRLAKQGVREFNVIAQDLSSYGLDLERRLMLPELIDRMADIDGVDWIRLHYAYPAQFPHEVLKVMASRPNVCNYLDIALQHISDPVLRNMHRHIDRAGTERLIDEIRSAVPGIALRTTLMVGFPGEGEKEFEELLEWVQRTRFERMGAFAYSEEAGTPAQKNLDDEVPQEVKQQRLDTLMKLQERIALEHQEALVGKTLKVIIDREEEDYFIGRTEHDSPEVDPEVLIRKSANLKPGQFAQAVITEAMPFELIAEPKID